MSYIPSECSIEQYNKSVYNADAKHKCFLSFNGVEYENVDDKLSKIVINSKCIDTTNKVFMLNNLIAKSIEITIHDIDINVIQDPIVLKIATYVDDIKDFVYVPIGVFNLQETPTTSNGITTIKARDNSVLLDKPYDGQELIQQKGGSATKLEILQDICNRFNITCNVSSFRGANELVGTYDNTINARYYVSWLAEQSGSIAYIDRLGALNFIQINNLPIHRLDLNDISKYTNDLIYKVSRVIYGDGVYQYPFEEQDNDILYLDVNNPYITSNEIVAEIYNIVNNFEVNSFQIEKIYGSCLVDSFDLIQVNDFKTLANNTLIYNGKLMQSFDTQISREKRETNVSINENSIFKKYVKIQIDGVEGTISEITGKVDTLDKQTADNITLLQDTLNGFNDKLEGYALRNDLLNIQTEVNRIQTDTYTKTEIQQIIRGQRDDGVEVEYVSTKQVLIDNNGLTIDQTGDNESKTKSNLDTDGLIVIDKTGANNEPILEARYDEIIGETVVRSKRMKVEKYLTIGTHSRFEDYEDGTGCFYLGGN